MREAPLERPKPSLVVRSRRRTQAADGVPFLTEQDMKKGFPIGFAMLPRWSRRILEMKNSKSLYLRHRFPEAVISCADCWYFRFQSSSRDIEELLFERGVVVIYEGRAGFAFVLRLTSFRQNIGANRCLLSLRESQEYTAGWPFEVVIKMNPTPRIFSLPYQDGWLLAGPSHKLSCLRPCSMVRKTR